MSWDTIFVGSLMLTCISAGVLLGAWWFEGKYLKDLLETIKERGED